MCELLVFHQQPPFIGAQVLASSKACTNRAEVIAGHGRLLSVGTGDEQQIELTAIVQTTWSVFGMSTSTAHSLQGRMWITSVRHWRIRGAGAYFVMLS